jgi:hypothetical protein
MIKIKVKSIDGYFYYLCPKKLRGPGWLNELGSRTTDHGQATVKLYHLRLRIECTIFVAYKVEREPTPYW